MLITIPSSWWKWTRYHPEKNYKKGVRVRLATTLPASGASFLGREYDVICFETCRILSLHGQEKTKISGDSIGNSRLFSLALDYAPVLQCNQVLPRYSSSQVHAEKAFLFLP